MKTKKDLGFRRLAENRPAQRHSKFSKSVIGVMRVIGVMGDMGQERIVKKRYTQRHSKFSKSGNRPLCPLCLFSPLASNNSSAQRHSKFSKWGICPMGLMGHIGPIEKENQPAQRHSKFSKCGNRPLSPLCLLSPLDTKNSPAQRHSKFSKCGNRPLSPLCLLSPLDTKNSPAQRHSKFSKSVIGVMRVIGVMGDMGQERIVKKRYTQGHSKFSKCGNRPLCPLCLFSPLAPKNTPAQRRSKMCKFTKLSIVKRDLNFFP